MSANSTPFLSVPRKTAADSGSKTLLTSVSKTVKQVRGVVNSALVQAVAKGCHSLRSWINLIFFKNNIPNDEKFLEKLS